MKRGVWTPWEEHSGAEEAEEVEEPEVGLSSSLLRFVGLDADPLRCFCINNEALWWVSKSGILFYWKASALETDPVAVADLGFACNFICVTWDGAILVASSERVAFYCLQNELSPRFLGGELGNDGSGDDESHLMERSYVLEEVLIHTCQLEEDIAHVDLSPDGSVASISTQKYLALAFSDDYKQSNSTPTGLLYLDCRQLGMAKEGCSRTCFLSPTRLCVLDSLSHLVTVHIDHDARAISLVRDGHILSRTNTVTALKTSGGADGLVFVGFSNGTVQVLQADTLQAYHTFDIRTGLQPSAQPSDTQRRSSGGLSSSSTVASQMVPLSTSPPQVSRRLRKGGNSSTNTSPESGGAERVSSDVGVADIAVGSRLVSVCTSEAVVFWNRQTRHVEPLRTVQLQKFAAPNARLISKEGHLEVSVSSNGTWAMWAPGESMLYYSALAVDVEVRIELQRENEQKSGYDIIHAKEPLPPTWQDPFTLTSARLDMPRSPQKGLRGAKSKHCNASALQPVTFGHGVKSSGYTEAPWSVEQERKRKAAIAAKKKAEKQASDDVETAKQLCYENPAPFNEHPLVLMETASHSLCALHQGAVLSVGFNAAGNSLVSGGADARVSDIRFPVAKLKRTGALMGSLLGRSSAPVSSLDCNLSLQNELVVTGSTDGSLRLWMPYVRDAPIVVQEASSSSGRSTIHTAQFYYLDKFILYDVGNEFRLCKYALPPSSKEKGAISPAVFSFRVAAHSITAMDSVNHFASNLVLVAASNKEISAVDVITNTAVITTPVQNRSIYRLKLGRHTRYASSSSFSDHMLVSATLDSTVTLWDLRSPAAVQKFSHHKNTATPVLDLDISPGGTYIAVGSEDQAVYLYDARSGSAGPVEVLSDLKACATSISWHPTEHTLVVGMTSGDVKLFNPNP